MHILNSILFVVVFLNSNIAQDFVHYDQLIYQARTELYSNKDTLQALKTYQKAFRSTPAAFGLHISEYIEAKCHFTEAGNDSDFLKDHELVFSNEADKNLFLKRHCDLVGFSLNVLDDNTQRKLLDEIFEEDQNIDRNAPNSTELFDIVLNKLRLFISKFGFPTERKVGLYLNEKGDILNSPMYTMLIHAIQTDNSYFIQSIDSYYQKGFITGSEWRLLKKTYGSKSFK